VGRGGLVRDREAHAAVIRGVTRYFGTLGFGAVDVRRGAVAGRKSGNTEYPVHLLRGAKPVLDEARIRGVVGGG
jgi:predicted rRNA methylase YqxC with S4 and FtsJ domains